MKRRKIKLWAVISWLLVWQACSMAVKSDIFLVSPLRVVSRLFELAVTAKFWQSIGFSLARIGSGFLLAMCCGIVLAALAARYSRIEELLAPAVLAIKTIPVASFIILALIWFSSRNLAVLISFLMVLPIIYTNVLDGIRAVKPEMLEMAALFRIPAVTRVRCVYLPEVMPFFRSGCTVALGLCWKSGIAAEVIGVPKGSIGEHLQQAKIYLETPDLFAWTIVIVLVSVLFEKIIRLLLDRLAARLMEV